MTPLLILPTLISWILGWLLLKCLTPKPNSWGLLLESLIGLGLGLGTSAILTFSSFVFFNQWLPLYTLTIHVALILLSGTFCFFQYRQKNIRPSCNFGSPTEWIFLLILVIISIPLWYQVFFYAYGGWDAWSTWNFKAKFLFLSAENWQNLFDPKLWRSSPHYPLFVPLSHVWSWTFQTDPIYQGPAFNAFLFTFATNSLLALSLYHFTRSRAAIWPALILLTMPFYNKLALSQYADNILAFYLLLSAVLWIKFNRDQRTIDLGLCGFFLGLMCFIKNEGLLAAGILAPLICGFLILDKRVVAKTKKFLIFLSGLVAGAIPAIIFTTFYAPKNITFVNGLLSAAKPSTWFRLKTIFSFYSLEFFAPLWNIIALFIPDLEAGSFICKWNGIWILLSIGLILSIGRCFRRPLTVFALFIPTFMAVITAYYQLNTYFDIEWWLQVSLHRIISQFLPLLIFWVFLSLWEKSTLIFGKKSLPRR